MHSYEMSLARRLGKRSRAWIDGVLVVRCRADTGITVVTPCRSSRRASARTNRGLNDLWSADRMFVWVLRTGDKMRVHDLRIGKPVHPVRRPPTKAFRARRGRIPRATHAGRDLQEEVLHRQIRFRESAPWPPALRKQISTLILPEGAMVLAVPEVVARHTCVVDILVDPAAGDVTMLWGSGMHRRIVDERTHLMQSAA